jgi:putative ATPase
VSLDPRLSAAPPPFKIDAEALGSDRLYCTWRTAHTSIPMTDLFTAAGFAQEAPRPLADRLRPTRLAEVVGQDHLLGPEGALTRLVASGSLGSLILWGPPGTGKTTVARLLARETSLGFVQLSAIFSGVAELRKVFEEARARRRTGQGTLLFVDEVHRFNRAQQDSFLPVMEDGTITLVGATTENPSFELNAALLSRARVMIFRALDEPAIERLLLRAEAVEGKPLPLDETARAALRRMADGDGRAALTLAEEARRAAKPGEIFDRARLAEISQRRAPIYDKAQEGHYNLISALHKCVRGSDPDAALYYLARMLDAGEDPLFIARRVVRMAVEDVGLADPRALVLANAAKDAYDFLGSPEGELAIAEALVYVATAPKSNAVYAAYNRAVRLAKEHGSLMPPRLVLNAPTKLMKDEGYGAGYTYDHDTPEGCSGQDYWPEALGRRNLYHPTERGFEKILGERLAAWSELRRTKPKGR